MQAVTKPLPGAIRFLFGACHIYAWSTFGQFILPWCVPGWASKKIMPDGLIKYLTYQMVGFLMFQLVPDFPVHLMWWMLSHLALFLPVALQLAGEQEWNQNMISLFSNHWNKLLYNSTILCSVQNWRKLRGSNLSMCKSNPVRVMQLGTQTRVRCAMQACITNAHSRINCFAGG